MTLHASIKKVKRSYFVMTLWRIALLYILQIALRLVLFLYNRDLIGEISYEEADDLLRGMLLFDTASILYTNALWIALSLLPLRSRTKRWYQESLFWLYMVTNATLITFLNFADSVFFHYGQKRISGDVLIFTQNTNNQNLAIEFVLDNWWMFPVGFAMMILVGYGYRRRAELVDIHRSSGYFYILYTAIAFGVMFLTISLIRGGFSKESDPITISNATLYTTENNKAHLILSNPFCLIQTLERKAIQTPHYFEKEQLNELFSPYNYPSSEQILGATHKGYNVMIFILESFSAENSAHLSPQLYREGDRGYMPFIDSRLREGVTFEKMYANGYQSISSTPAILGSIPSLEVPFVLYPNSVGESRQLPAILREMGYSTAFFCGSERSSMGFEAYTKAAGVDRYFAREDYEARHGYNDFDEMWGIWDMPFCEYVGEELSELREPFFAAQFTTTSHHPFNIEKKYKNKVPKGKTLIQPVTAYTDMAIENFFEKNRDKEWFNRTIFIFVADHVSSEKMTAATHKYPGNCHILGGIYTPDGSLKGSISQVTQQIDIMPTLLTLLGNEKPYFAFGRDIFARESAHPRWSITYDGTTSAYDTEAGVIRVENNDRLKAFEQQYFEHIERATFVVPQD